MAARRTRQEALSFPRIPAKRAPQDAAAALWFDAGVERARAGELQERSERARAAAIKWKAVAEKCERKLRRH